MRRKADTIRDHLYRAAQLPKCRLKVPPPQSAFIVYILALSKRSRGLYSTVYSAGREFVFTIGSTWTNRRNARTNQACMLWSASTKTVKYSLDGLAGGRRRGNPRKCAFSKGFVLRKNNINTRANTVTGIYRRRGRVGEGMGHIDHV